MYGFIRKKPKEVFGVRSTTVRSRELWSLGSCEFFDPQCKQLVRYKMAVFSSGTHSTPWTKQGVDFPTPTFQAMGPDTL